MFSELLFLALLLTGVAALLIATAASLAGHKQIAMCFLKGMATGAITYLAIVALVAVLTPQQVFQRDEPRCFDDMCFLVDGVQTTQRLGPPDHQVRARGKFYVVTMRVSNRGLGRTQREAGIIRALLWDTKRSYPVSIEGQRAYEAESGVSARLDVRLQPGETVQSVQVFDGPVSPSLLGVILSHGFTPGVFVIGECPLFHKPTIIQLMP